jgi:hypothetical protein
MRLVGTTAGLFSALALSLAVGGCKKPPAEGGGGAGSGAPFKPAAPVASGLPGVNEKVSKVVNPKNEPIYSGPAGSVSGTVTASGDLAPATPEHLARIKGRCPEARELYGHLFREGMMRSLADVLVAVTGYQGYVPEKEPKQTIAARGCAFSTRTMALTYGQTIDLVSKDAEGYVPNLLGSHMAAQMIALPGGAPSTLYPPEPGHYLLTDDIKVYMLTDVFVLAYATHDVTSLDGHFSIQGIPAGKVMISALLPNTGGVVEKEIEIKAGQNTELNLDLPFDAKKYAAIKAAAAASASAGAAVPSSSAAPAPSAQH